MEPRSDEVNDELDEDADDIVLDEAEELEDEEEEDDLADSDTDTVETNDTTVTTETVDSLFENVRFPKEEEEVVKEKPAKPQIDLGELVKQDLRKIVTTVEYFDEEKFEGGKKIKSFHKKQKEAEEAKASDDKLDESTSNENKEEDSDQTAETDSTSKPQEPEISSKRKSAEDTGEISEKKVKTSSGTFSVSDK